MSAIAVAKKDFRSARRSRSLWLVATLLGLLTALIGYSYEGYQITPTESVQQLFAQIVLLLSLLLPIVALVASYMSIAGERESGGVKFLLSLPNTRRDVFLGKFCSRLAVVGAGIVFMFLTATVGGVARNGTLPVGFVVALLAITLVYGGVFVSIAVALSSMVAARSKAIAAAVGSYFLLVLLYVVPGLSVFMLAQWVHTTLLGFDTNLDLYNAVSYTSPLTAYRQATNMVFPESAEQRVFRRASDAGELPVYLSEEVSLFVFAVWLVVPLVVGYVRFQGADLE
ncbi:ABC-2 type transporter [Halobacteriales archaeon QS_4_62_28]|nr:MAG: ABC-2 type transporter [Halobacteriales archaeon QS_4_62_28]